MEDRMTFDIFTTISKLAEESLELSVTTAELYDMSEGQAVDQGLKSFFTKITDTVGKRTILSFMSGGISFQPPKEA